VVEPKVESLSFAASAGTGKDENASGYFNLIVV